jgi:hypothetical protein
MQRPKPGNPNTTQDDGDAKASSLRSRAADSAWLAQDRVRADTREGIDRVLFPLQKKLLWPLQDRAAAMGAPARALSTAAAIVLAAGAGIAGLLLATSSGSGDRPATAAVAAVSTPAPRAEPSAEPEPREPARATLQGAAPSFEPARRDASPTEVDPARAVVKSSPAESQGNEAGAASTSSDPGASAAKAGVGKDAAIDGPPAGPAAIAVARDFSDAFVVYETGGLDPRVRKVFGATATPELAKALLRRPPRLPANVEVPKAKVLNVVPGPSHGGVYSVSVSLLRVGVTSELRLDLEQLKGKEWRVTNVLG